MIENESTHYFLQKIIITGRPIREFAEGAFLGLYNLKRLALIHCYIKVMPPLGPTKHSLEGLDLSHNELVFIEANYFVGFHRLITLYFRFNYLSAIPDVSPLAGILFMFDIKHNLVLSLRPFLLNDTFFELKHLAVSYNNVSELTPVMISQWPRLTSLNVEYNLLETLRDLSRITREFLLEVMSGNQIVGKNKHRNISSVVYFVKCLPST